eukprot:NODE_261_length_2807_cov_87.258197_g245_i0.p1 GENE.NODE_261_length_2807_cov_87.258197_g245_i0~~NODE_261_length_2807_cov_87.258197_g245_i0.p1  ORF type:complete len:820 (+),score=152.23 NODE_261_length_2807_cov_87.258197_g245_i0:102-2561(+)
MSAPLSFRLSLFEQLYDPDDADFCSPLFKFTAEVQHIIDTKGGSAPDVLAEQLAELTRDQEQADTDIAVQQHAREKLIIEQKRIENTIASLESKRKEIATRKRYVQASMKRVMGTETDTKIDTLSNLAGDDQDKLESFLWLLQNTGKSVKEDAVIKGLQQFESFCILVVENAWTAHTVNLWMDITRALLVHLTTALPRQQIIDLRILTEILKRSNNTANQPTDHSLSPMCNAVVNNNGLRLLIKLLNSVNDDVKTEAIACLVATCTTIASKELFGQMGGIEALIGILNRSNSELVLQQALIALWNQAMSDHNKALVRSVKGLGSVINMLHMDNDVILENATIALGYLTRDDQNKVAIRDCNGIEKLLACLYYPNESIQSKAAGALWNCASNAQNKVFIRELGGIATLIELLNSTHESVQENAAGGLWNCAVDSENKKLVRELGGLQPLIQLLSSSNPAIVENASGTLWNCAAIAENRCALRKLGGIQPLLMLLWSRNENIQENGAGAIRNCSFNDQNKIAYRELGGIQMFVELLDKTSFPVLEKIISTLLICSINAENKDCIRQCGGFPKLLHCLSHSEVCIREKALGILRNCSTTADNRVALIQCHGIPRLVQVLNNAPDTLTEPMKEYAAASLWNLARDDTSKATAREEGAMTALVRLLQDSGEAVVENAAGALLSLTINADNRDHIRKINGVNHLVSLLKSSNEFILENVVGALKNCTASNEANQVLVRELGGLEPLIALLSNPNDNVVREATLCLKNMASNDENNRLIGTLNGVSQLVKLVQSASSSELIRKVAAFALQTLARNPQNRTVIDKGL